MPHAINEEGGAKPCTQCEKPFDPASNGHDACVWHTGRLEVDRDDDTWADHDENCHGPIEPRGWLLQQFPDGFYWACCEKRGSNPGCQRDFHRTQDGGQGTSA